MRRSRESWDEADRPARQRVQDRRLHHRAVEALHVLLRDARGREIGRGKTANISEGGVYVVLRSARGLPQVGCAVQVEVSFPAAGVGGRGSRNVRYSATIVRTVPMGPWVGVALEFISKLS